MKTLILLVTLMAQITCNAHAGLFFSLSKLQPKTENKTIERKLNKAGNKAGEKKFEIPKLKLKGIVHSKDNIAIINGLYLKKGDTIEGCRILKVNRDSVELKCGSLPVKLTIDLINSSNGVDNEEK